MLVPTLLSCLPHAVLLFYEIAIRFLHLCIFGVRLFLSLDLLGSLVPLPVGLHNCTEGKIIPQDACFH